MLVKQQTQLFHSISDQITSFKLRQQQQQGEKIEFSTSKLYELDISFHPFKTPLENAILCSILSKYIYTHRVLMFQAYMTIYDDFLRFGNVIQTILLEHFPVYKRQNIFQLNT